MEISLKKAAMKIFLKKMDIIRDCGTDKQQVWMIVMMNLENKRNKEIWVVHQIKVLALVDVLVAPDI